MPPQKKPTASISSGQPQGFWGNAYDTVRNSALGYAVESSLPGLADAIGMHPNQTAYSPDYQASRENALNPQFMVPSDWASQNRGWATARGALKGAGSMTSGRNMAMVGGALATGGLSAGAGLGLGALMTAQGGYNLGKQAYHGLDLNNANPESYENFGDFLFNAAQLGAGVHGMSKGMDAHQAQAQAQIRAQREGNMVYRAQPLDNAGEGVRDFNSPAQATNDPAQALQYKSDLENQTGVPHEVVRINRNMLPQDSYETAPHPSGAEWTKFKGDVPDHAIDRSPTPVDLAQQIYDAHQQNGGATFSGSGQNLVGTPNYAVSMFPDLGEVHGQDFGASHIQNFMQRPEVQAQLARGGAVGTWHDQSSGQHYLDVSATTPNRNLATQLGEQYNQKAIFDLNGLNEIPTGGTGETIPNLPPVDQRMNALQPSFWQGTANAIQRNPMLRPILGMQVGQGFAAHLTLGDALGMPQEQAFDRLQKGIDPEDALSSSAFPISQLSVNRRSLEGAQKNTLLGRGSRTEGPIDVFYDTHAKQFLVEDGHHRLATAVNNGQATIPAKIRSGYSDTIPTVAPEDRMASGPWSSPVSAGRVTSATDFDPSSFGQEPGPSNILAPRGTTPAKRFKSVVPDSVAQNLTPGWENILKSPIAQKAMMNMRGQLASPEEVQASAQMSQASGFMKTTKEN